MTLHQLDEMLRAITFQCRDTKGGIGGEKITGAAGKIGEIAAPTARHQNLATRTLGMIQHQHALAGITSRKRTHQPGSTGANDYYVRIHASLPRSEERRVGKECRARWAGYAGCA